MSAGSELHATGPEKLNARSLNLVRTDAVQRTSNVCCTNTPIKYVISPNCEPNLITIVCRSIY